MRERARAGLLSYSVVEEVDDSHPREEAGGRKQ